MEEDRTFDEGYEEHRRDYGTDHNDNSHGSEEVDAEDVEDYAEEEQTSGETEKDKEQDSGEGTDGKGKGEKDAGEETKDKGSIIKRLFSKIKEISLSLVNYLGMSGNAFIRGLLFGDSFDSRPFDIIGQAKREMEADALQSEIDGKKETQEQGHGDRGNREERGNEADENVRNAHRIKDALCKTADNEKGINIGAHIIDPKFKTDVVNENGVYMFRMNERQIPLTKDNIRNIGQGMLENIIEHDRPALNGSVRINNTPEHLLASAVKAGLMQSAISLACEDLTSKIVEVPGQANVVRGKHLCDIKPAPGFGRVSFDLKYKENNGVKEPYIEAKWKGQVISEVNVTKMLDESIPFHACGERVYDPSVLDDIKKNNPNLAKKLEEIAKDQCERIHEKEQAHVLEEKEQKNQPEPSEEEKSQPRPNEQQVNEPEPQSAKRQGEKNESQPKRRDDKQPEKQPEKQENTKSEPVRTEIRASDIINKNEIGGKEIAAKIDNDTAWKKRWNKVAAMDSSKLSELSAGEREDLKYYADKYVEEHKANLHSASSHEQETFMSAKNASMRIEKYENSTAEFEKKAMEEFHASDYEQEEDVVLDLKTLSDVMREEPSRTEQELESEEAVEDTSEMDEMDGMEEDEEEFDIG